MPAHASSCEQCAPHCKAASASGRGCAAVIAINAASPSRSNHVDVQVQQRLTCSLPSAGFSKMTSVQGSAQRGWQ